MVRVTDPGYSFARNRLGPGELVTPELIVKWDNLALGRARLVTHVGLW